MFRVNKNLNCGGGKSYAKNSAISEKDENFEAFKKAGHLEEIAEAGEAPPADAAPTGEGDGEESGGVKRRRR